MHRRRKAGAVRLYVVTRHYLLVVLHEVFAPGRVGVGL